MAGITTRRLPSGWTAVVLENEMMSVTLLPEKGSEVYSLISRKHDVDLLWKSPWGLRKPVAYPDTAPGSETAWLDGYAGGWQELFPNGGEACEYRGAQLGFHGEASVAPWTWSIDPQSVSGPGVLLALRCARSPFRLKKRVSIDANKPVLSIHEEITNEGSDRMPYMWGHHPAYGAPFLASGCTLTVPATSYEADVSQPPGRTWVEPGVEASWPNAVRAGGGTIDVSAIPGPEAGVANLGYVKGLREGWYALFNPNLQLGVGLTWPMDVFPYLWLWQEFQGSLDYPWYGSTYVMGVEPHTSIPGHGLLRAIERGTAGWLDPGERVEADISAVLFEGDEPVSRIAPDGTVER